MKVTRLIREYVAEPVMAKYPETEDEKQYTKEIKIIEDKVQELNEKVKDYALDLCEQANKDLGIDNWAIDDHIHLYSPTKYLLSSGWNNPYVKSLNSLKEERTKKINDTIKNILVNLELGATKAELDEMLKNLGEDK